jgi:hypothetical protein
MGLGLSLGVAGRGGGAPSAFAPAREVIIRGQRDLTMLFIGDSTGNETTEWIYLFATWLSQQYPTHSVSYALWNDTTGAYDPATAISTGTGARSILVYNASVAGTAPMYLLGDKRAAAIDAVAADVVVWNHGHNLVTSTNQKGELLSGWETTRLAHPGASQVVFLQNPNRDDEQMAAVYATLISASRQYGDVTLIDGYDDFIAAGKPAGWYTDNQHPNSTGQGVLLEAAKAVWRVSASPYKPVSGWLAQTGTNLLANGNFSDWTGALPASWSSLASATATKDTAIKASGAGYSARVEGTTAQAALIQSLSAGNLTLVQGRSVTLAALEYVPAGSATTVGRVAVTYFVGATTTVTSRASAVPTGGFVWNIVIASIPANATSAGVRLYCDTAANTSSKAYYDRAVMIVGDTPRNMA